MGAAPVLQRAMGMELETRRAVVGPDGNPISTGDTTLLEHPYFTLVTDHFGGYSNLELVMKHFNQLAGTESQAIEALTQRLVAMKALTDQLYASTRKIGAIPGVGTGLTDLYAPKHVGPLVGGYSATEASVAPAPVDDGKLYVHYTVGFEPKDWFAMVKAVRDATRDDTEKSRPKTHAGYAISAVPVVLDRINTTALTSGQREELRGHLALMYMQMSVFTEKTMNMQLPALKKQHARHKKKADEVRSEIARVKKDKSLNLLERDNLLEPLRKELKRLAVPEKKTADKMASIDAQSKYGTGMQKNKIAALPRATLNQMYGALAVAVQKVLRDNSEAILEAFSDHLEATLGLDFNDFELVLKIEGKVEASATMEKFLEAGMGSGKDITQQVLFGGMKEVGIDTSVMGKKLLPLELRSVFHNRVTWAELLRDATKVLKWSRNPQGCALV